MNKKYGLIAVWAVLCLFTGIGVGQIIIGNIGDKFTQEEFNLLSKRELEEFDFNIKLLDEGVVEYGHIVYKYSYEMLELQDSGEWEIVSKQAAFMYPVEHYDNCINSGYSKYFCDAVVRENIIQQAEDSRAMIVASWKANQYERNIINVGDIGVTDEILNET